MDLKEKIEAANARALEIIAESQPRWVDVRPAIDVVPRMEPNLVLHAGPPIAWEQMCNAQKKGVLGAVIYEGLAGDIKEAEAMARAGEILVDSCHEHSAVGSMTGITSASMPVIVVEDQPSGNQAYVNIHEGPSRHRLTYGAFNDKVLENLLWIRDVLGPALAEAVRAMGGLALTPIAARALTMGDEVHNRAAASSALFALQILPHLVEGEVDRANLAIICSFLADTEHFFLHLAMAAHKTVSDAISGIPYCSVVTVMARNGVETGIRVSATGDRWFTGPAASIEGTYFSGYGPEDAEADIGDSAITETLGLGAFAMAASIPMAQAVGGSARDAVEYQETMAEITIGRHPAYRVPALDFQGTPVGIDIRKVVATGVLPIIDTGIADKNGGEIGVGLARPPVECFSAALKGFNDTIGVM